MGNTLRANVAEKLADIWLATHLRETERREGTYFTGVTKT